MYCWWADVVKESHSGTDHTPVVQIGLRYGFILFIISEVMFFVAWFWSFFRYALFTQPETAEFAAGMCQALEYSHAYHDGLTLQNTYYGASFFMATGFHGFHVFIGTIFLIVCLIRVGRGHFTAERHIGFEAAAWYWHFVDVVWLFLFASIYIGSATFFAVGTH